MKAETMTMEDIRLEGLEALSKRLGPVGMVRFIQQYQHGRGDYSKERHALLAGTSVRDIANRIRKRQGKRTI